MPVPGYIVEVDEVEIDMINVSSRDSRQVVGRAVMYLAVDVFSAVLWAAGSITQTTRLSELQIYLWRCFLTAVSSMQNTV